LPSIVLDGDNLGESIDAVRKLWNRLPLSKHMTKTNSGFIPSDESIVMTYYKKIRPVLHQATYNENYELNMLDAVRRMFELFRGRVRAQKLWDFYCGETVGLADFCMWAVYLKMIRTEPYLVPIVMDSYVDLKPYFGRLTAELGGRGDGKKKK